MIGIAAFILKMSFASSTNLIFTNPIFDGSSASPSILRVGDFYYLTLAHTIHIAVYKSSVLTSFRNVEERVIFRVPEGFIALESNEMLNIDGELYLYFHMIADGSYEYQLYVMKANNAFDPMGDWNAPVRLLNDWQHSASHGTVLKHNSQLYFIWVGAIGSYSLFIAPMTSPTTVGNPRMLLKEPTEVWECEEYCVVEAASLMYSNNVSYLVYSASHPLSPNSSLGQMSILQGKDPLIMENWQFVNEPIFSRNDDEDVYNVGRPEFIPSPDGTETWMVYHATVSPVHLDGRRTARLEKIEWNEDGSPRFPRPVGIHQRKSVPSGQLLTCA